jgi:superfamily II DNA or RNA helicase
MPIPAKPHPDSPEGVLAECGRLREENRRLRELLAQHGIEIPGNCNGCSRQMVSEPQPSSALLSRESAANEKIALFRSLFRGREDVYAVRWEGKDGRFGYSPACVKDWDAIRAAKPGERKKIERRTRTLLPLTDEVIRDHLAGKHTIGVYPLLADDSCWFLAVDFDKKSWEKDSTELLAVCQGAGVPAALERSRSGKGGHVWVFFNQPVSAALARNLGSALLTRAMEKRHEIGLGSYDRLFPNQDRLPKGGFGNLIALPLQKNRRDGGNSVFVDRDFNPYPDQWRFLSSIERMPASGIESLLKELAPQGDVVGVRSCPTEEETPWTLSPSRKRAEPPIEGPLPSQVRIVRGHLLFIEKAGLPPALLNRLIRLAAFQNPEFYRAQAMRLSTFGKPRVIGCAEDFPKHLGLPRGCLEELLQLFERLGIGTKVIDERSTGHPIEASFVGKLRPEQQKAAERLLQFDEGLLCAPTAFGKTVVASWLISERKVNTLVLVHRGQLLDQWRERLASFLNVPAESIGRIGGGKEQITGRIDVAMIQSLYRKGEVKDLVAGYGHVIVDECHHISAFSFEQVLKQVKARFVVGLTATPTRKDGHHPIIFMQCGPIRYHPSRQAQAGENLVQQVIPRHTEFRLPPIVEAMPEPGIQDIFAALEKDQDRLGLIVADVLKALESGCFPLVLTGRREQVDQLEARLKESIKNVVILRGGMGRKQRQAVRDEIAGIPEGEPRVIVATGSCIGEGFDDAQLDTLFLAWPISWKGTLQQYVGRLHRVHANKKVVRVYDYVDSQVAMLSRMFAKRVRGYTALGYVIEEPVKTPASKGVFHAALRRHVQ